MSKLKRVIFASVVFLSPSRVVAEVSQLDSIKQEIQALKSNYESRIAELEAKLKVMEQQKSTTEDRPTTSTKPLATDSSGRNIYGNVFNPSIGVILNGRYSSYSEADSELRGFDVGEEGERGREGLAVDESELNFSSDVDDKFFGSLTAAIVREDGEDKVELEEAFFETRPGLDLPQGLTIKGGRAFWTFGYLNEHHSHTDDFADRPLPNRAFLNKAFNDDGAQLSYVLPTDFYSEVGGGIFRGDDYPFGDAQGSAVNSWSGFARVGGDIGENQDWRIGGYFLGGDADDRVTAEDSISFIGDSELYAADIKYRWAPTGNSREQELTLQGEYIWRNDDGTYEDRDADTGVVEFDELSSGFYAQAVYKFLPQWRVGARYSNLFAPNVPEGLVGSALDSEGHDPKAYAVMVDWTNSEFSRLRFQYNLEELSTGENDNQFIFQYIMSIGAHGAHAY